MQSEPCVIGGLGKTLFCGWGSLGASWPAQGAAILCAGVSLVSGFLPARS